MAVVVERNNFFGGNATINYWNNIKGKFINYHMNESKSNWHGSVSSRLICSTVVVGPRMKTAVMQPASSSHIGSNSAMWPIETTSL